MTSEKRQQIAQKIETALLFVWGVTLLLFPLALSTLTTEGFILPKEILLATVTLVSLVLWGAQMLLNKQVRVRRTPLDIPILLFVVASILSSVFSTNRLDSLTATVGIIFVGLSYFVLTNVLRSKKAALFLLSCLVTGGVLATIITLLARYNVYLLPFAATKVSTFTPLGTYTEYALIMAMLLPLTFSYLLPIFKNQFSARVGVFALGALALLAGIVVVGIQLATAQKPVLLPFDTGFQTAFAAISQDSGRVLQTFFFGEGYGNFASIFARFHNSAFNANQQLWFLSFTNSSSYLLELLATTGLVGVLSFLFLGYKTLMPVDKKRQNPFYISLLVGFILSILLPFSLIEVAVLFFFLAGFSLYQREYAPQDYFDIELKFVALKKGVVSFTTLDTMESGRMDNHPTPIVAFVTLLALVVVLGYYSVLFVASDVIFQESLTAATNNNGTVTYRLQSQAIGIFPYRSDYYRIFSQTNVALANSLLSLNTGHAPSTSSQQTAFALIQQAISTGRQATALSPDSPVAWQNLSSIYRALIGVGQNAQDFAIASAQQATVLDSNNPQEYLNLGGLYYQLGQYDNAIRMFQQAINLKSDYSNAYYNLGHAYEQKGDLQNALAQYQTVATLVASDKANEAKIQAEIAALQAKIGKGTATTPVSTQQGSSTQQQLSLPQANQLPAQPTQVPLVSPTPSK